MSREPFSPASGAVVVGAEIDWQPPSQVIARLIVDTGATETALSHTVLRAAGYDPDASPFKIDVVTASGVETVPVVVVLRLTALGVTRTDFPVVCLTLPPDLVVDGVLGLDFFRGHVLTIDFRQGYIELT